MVSALVMARSPSPGSRLQAALLAVASGWAAEVAPGAAHLAYSGDERDIRPHLAEGVECFEQGPGDRGDRLTAAGARVFRERPEPLLIVGTCMPFLAPAHAREAEAVLRGGADVVFGPSYGGDHWLVGLSRPAPDLLDLGAGWDGPAVLERTLERAQALGLRAELLGMQRELESSADVRALTGHPRLPEAVAAALTQARG